MTTTTTTRGYLYTRGAVQQGWNPMYFPGPLAACYTTRTGLLQYASTGLNSAGWRLEQAGRVHADACPSAREALMLLSFGQPIM